MLVLNNLRLSVELTLYDGCCRCVLILVLSIIGIGMGNAWRVFSTRSESITCLKWKFVDAQLCNALGHFDQIVLLIGTILLQFSLLLSLILSTVQASLEECHRGFGGSISGGLRIRRSCGYGSVVVLHLVTYSFSVV